VYNVNYILFPPGIIEQQLPEKNKYTDFSHIETLTYDKVGEYQKKEMCRFICRHFLQRKDNIFAPKEDNIFPYFYGHNHSPFFSFYKEGETLIDVNKSTLIESKKTLAVMTSRPINVSINRGDKDSFFDAYYVDYLCVDTRHRKKGFAPKIIQTHHYNQRHLNTQIAVSIFKREEELTGIVPLCAYSTYGFSVEKWTKPPNFQNDLYSLVEVTTQNLVLLYDFLKQNECEFDIVMYPEMSNILELIKTKNIFVQMLLEKTRIVAVYFYRKTCVFIEKGMEVLSCFASICSTESHIFIQGFKLSFWNTAEKHYFGFAVIERISHNGIILDNLLEKNVPIVISPTAYFFYNFAYPTFYASKVLFLN
jgi:hypothetical protein